MSALTAQVQAAMEGAASAANSRSTSHAASRAQSPDLPFSQHLHDSPRASFQHESHLLVSSSSELQAGQSNPMQQRLSARDDAADSDSRQAASQPGGSHSSPAVNEQRPSSPSVNRAAAARAFLDPVDTTAAALLSPEASAAESKQTEDVPGQENPNSDATLSQQSHNLISYDNFLKENNSRSDDMLRQSGSLGYGGRSCELSSNIQQMQPASSMAGPEPDVRPHEASEACNLPQFWSLHHSASVPSMDSQSSCSNEHSLQLEVAPQAPVGPEASCNSDDAQCSVDPASKSAAELHRDTVAIPAVPARAVLHLGSSPVSSNSSCRHSLDGKALPPGGRDSTGMLLCSQAPVGNSIAVEDSRSTLDNSSTSPATASSSAAVVTPDTGPLVAPAQLCLPPDLTQAEAAPLQHASEHSVELASPLSQMHASQSATSQSENSNQVSYQTEQSRNSQGGASTQGGSSASSNAGWLAANRLMQQEMHFGSSLQVCKHEGKRFKQDKEIIAAVEGANQLCVQKQSGSYAQVILSACCRECS